MQSAGIQNLMRVDSLIASDINNILIREKDNDHSINLYNAGDVWVAFEKSAYLLEQLSDNMDMTMVIHLKDRPFPVIFNLITDASLQQLSKHTTSIRFSHNHIQILTDSFDYNDYKAWYRELVIE